LKNLNGFSIKPIDILLVEDNPGDVRLTKEALKEGKINNNLYVVGDGKEALDFLSLLKKHKDAVKPDLILLDLNLPKLDGWGVLKKIKTDSTLKRIPVVILTTSEDERDVSNAYNQYANCYITKPVDLEQFVTIVKTIEDFWFSIVRLPGQ
jgi:CheY-like chemotaxis protein